MQIIIDRGIDFSQIVKIESLPGVWQPIQVTKKDLSCWKLSVKGDMFGASYDGRLDIFSHDLIAPKVSDVALLESCIDVHRREDMLDKPLKIREYIRLSKIGQVTNLLPSLIWLTAKYKTTIKGFGRQYSYSLVGSPIWEKRVSGQCRTGRYGGVGSLAIVDDDHPLVVKENFNY